MKGGNWSDMVTCLPCSELEMQKGVWESGSYSEKKSKSRAMH